jgi:AraC family transcriptional regulator
MVSTEAANSEPTTGTGVLVHVASGSVASVDGFRHHPRPFRDPTEEWFDGDEVIFTTGGCWRIGGRRGWVDAGPGVVVLGHDGEPFRCDHGGTMPTDRNLAVRLNSGALGALLDLHPDPLSTMLAERPLPDLASLPLTPEVELTARRLAAETDAWLPGRGLRLDCLVVELLVGLHRAAGSPASTPRAVQPRQREAIEAVRRHIDAHLGEDLDLATLAALGHTSPFHFSRLFRTVTGLPPHRYLRRARLERAEQLLTGGDGTVTQVAHQVGFSSVSHFIAAFRRHTGTTPGQYRAIRRATEGQRGD